jgi:hypothetical protein
VPFCKAGVWLVGFVLSRVRTHAPGAPMVVLRLGVGWGGFVVSHPCDKDKDVARMGHPRVVPGMGAGGVGACFPGLRSETRGTRFGAGAGAAGLGLCFPTHGAMKLRHEWGTVRL